MKYRKKPVVIEAFQMTIERRWDNSEWPNWLNKAWNNYPGVEGFLWIDPDSPLAEGHESAAELICGTLEGPHKIDWDDWIIQGIKGEIHPCKPDIFEMTYELVEEKNMNHRFLLAQKQLDNGVARTAAGYLEVTSEDTYMKNIVTAAFMIADEMLEQNKDWESKDEDERRRKESTKEIAKEIANKK